MEIRDVMTESVVTATPQTRVREVAELMRERNVGSVLLLDDSGRAVGLITDRDLAIGVLAEGGDGNGRAGDHASAPVVTGAPSTSLEEAGELMISHGIRRLPVMDEQGRLTGIVTLDDLAVRSGDLELAHAVTSEIARAAMPGFYFHERGE